MIVAQVNGNPQKCALVQNSNNIVSNIIMADPSIDLALEGYLLIGLPDNSPVSFGWIYNPSTNQFTEPSQ